MKAFKMFKILLITVLIIIIFTGKTLALDRIFDQCEDWITTGKSSTNQTMNTEVLRDGSNDIYNLLLAIGTGVAVIVGAMLGIKYMTSGIEGQVKVKETLIPYLISCAVLFGSFGIWKLAITIMQNFN